MMRTRLGIFLLILFSLTAGVSAQRISNEAKISILTCGPGVDVYSLFGHCAVRVNDPVTNIDKVYNYGTFSFNEPGFIAKFAQGKLKYYLSTGRYQEFEMEYRHDGRWVKEQILALDVEEANGVFRTLENNALPENKYYLYDFFFDNCASRIREIIEKGLEGKLQFDSTYKTEAGDPTYRELLKPYLKTSPWLRFGIDMGLGSVVDDEATAKDFMFLPDYLMLAFSKAYVKRGGDYLPVVAETRTLVPDSLRQPDGLPFYQTPGFACWMLFLAGLGLTLLGITRRRNMYWFDIGLLVMAGLAGLLVALLWFATDHDATKANFNLMWLMPLHLVAAFFMLPKRRKKWLVSYFVLTGTLVLICVVGWFFLPQSFNPNFLPLMLLLLMRLALLPGKLQNDHQRRKAKLEAQTQN